jgi:hypothetical protein
VLGSRPSFLGAYQDACQAARAYDLASIALGNTDTAALNFPGQFPAEEALVHALLADGVMTGDQLEVCDPHV